MKNPKKAFALISLPLSFVLIFGSCTSKQTVATVNGTPIFRHDVEKEAYRRHAQEILNDLIANSLIRQEAKRQNIKLSSAEIELKIKDISENFKSMSALKTLLMQRGLSWSDFKQQVELQILAKRLVGPKKVRAQQLKKHYMSLKSERYENRPYNLVRKNVLRDYEDMITARNIPGLIQKLKKESSIKIKNRELFD